MTNETPSETPALSHETYENAMYHELSLDAISSSCDVRARIHRTSTWECWRRVFRRNRNRSAVRGWALGGAWRHSRACVYNSRQTVDASCVGIGC